MDLRIYIYGVVIKLVKGESAIQILLFCICSNRIGKSNKRNRNKSRLSSSRENKMFKSSITRRLHQDVRLVYSSSSSSSPSSFLFKMYHSEHLEKSISVGARQIPFILPCAIVIIIDVITCSLTSRHSHSHSGCWLAGKMGIGNSFDGC